MNEILVQSVEDFIKFKIENKDEIYMENQKIAGKAEIDEKLVKELRITTYIKKLGEAIEKAKIDDDKFDLGIIINESEKLAKDLSIELKEEGIDYPTNLYYT